MTYVYYTEVIKRVINSNKLKKKYLYSILTIEYYPALTITKLNKHTVDHFTTHISHHVNI